MATDGTNGTTTPPTSTEQIKTDIITLTRFLTEEQAKHKEATGDFTYSISPFPLPPFAANSIITASSFTPSNSLSSRSLTGSDEQALQTFLASPVPLTQRAMTKRNSM